MTELICIGDKIIEIDEEEERKEKYIRTFLLGGNLYILNRLHLLEGFWEEHGITKEQVDCARKYPDDCFGAQDGYLYAKENYGSLLDSLLTMVWTTMEFQTSLATEAGNHYLQKRGIGKEKQIHFGTKK